MEQIQDGKAILTGIATLHGEAEAKPAVYVDTFAFKTWIETNISNLEPKTAPQVFACVPSTGGSSGAAASGGDASGGAASSSDASAGDSSNDSSTSEDDDTTNRSNRVGSKASVALNRFSTSRPYLEIVPVALQDDPDFGPGNKRSANSIGLPTSASPR